MTQLFKAVSWKSLPWSFHLHARQLSSIETPSAQTSLVLQVAVPCSKCPPPPKKNLFSAFLTSVKLQPTKWTKGGVLTPGRGYSGCEVTKETRTAAGFLSPSWDSAQTSHMPSHAQAPRTHRRTNALAHLSQQGSSSSEQHPTFHTSLLTCKGSEYVSYWKRKKKKRN